MFAITAIKGVGRRFANIALKKVSTKWMNSNVDSTSQKRRIFGGLLPIFGRQVEVDHCGCRWPNRPQWVRSVTFISMAQTSI